MSDPLGGPLPVALRRGPGRQPGEGGPGVDRAALDWHTRTARGVRDSGFTGVGGLRPAASRATDGKA